MPESLLFDVAAQPKSSELLARKEAQTEIVLRKIKKPYGQNDVSKVLL